MKQNADINEMAFTLEVDREALASVRKEPTSRLMLPINDDNYQMVLENINGHLVLCTDEMPDTYHGGFGFNWSIYEWQKAKVGDIYYMMRVGDDKAGIFFRGIFHSAPYSGDDWAGKGRPRKYVDITCECCAPPDAGPWFTAEELSAAIPEITWGRGHSGELLPPDVADRLENLWNEKMKRK